MKVTSTTVNDIITADEPGFACSKTKLVDTGLVHLRPFNISLDGQLFLHELYQVPPREAPAGRSRVDAGDILFNNTNSAELVGKSALVGDPIDAGFSNHINRIRVDRSKVDPRWFALWLRKKRESGFFSKNATRWVSQAAYKTCELRKLPIDLPSLSEQRRIADLLSRSENIVRMRREAEQKAKEIIPALFLDMFGDPGTNPKGWDVKPLGQVIALIDSGKSPKCLDQPGQRDEWAVLKLGAVTWGDYDETQHKTLPPDVPAFPSSEVHIGDVLLSRKNTYELVGAAAYVWHTRGRVLLPDLIFRLNIGDSGVLEATYLWALLSTESKRRQLRGLASGAASSMPNISKARLARLPLEVPPIRRQRQFAALLIDAHDLESQEIRASSAAVKTFRSLLAEVFRE